MMLALDAGAEDFEASEEVYEITTDPADFSAVREKIRRRRFRISRSRSSNGSNYNG